MEFEVKAEGKQVASLGFELSAVRPGYFDTGNSHRNDGIFSGSGDDSRVLLSRPHPRKNAKVKKTQDHQLY